MNSLNNAKDLCRICLDENVISNWNNTLFDDPEITYKDCYFKYTQLKCLDPDAFSSMLCENCLIGMQNMHNLILRAIESHKYFEDLNLANLQIQDEEYLFCHDETDLKCNPTEFETVLIDEHNEEEYAPSEQQLEEKHPKIVNRSRRAKRKIQKSDHLDNNEDQCPTADNNTAQDNLLKTLKQKTLKQHSGTDEEKEESKDKPENIETMKLDSNNCEKVKNKKPRKKTSMCCVCSRVFRDKASAERHELTHAKNRERKETCHICGLKLYTNKSLLQHLETHDKNRVKTQKCEFCPKAFYSKGGLNIHRRLHLGQLITCTLCPKQFFRKYELQRHMSLHSTVAINAEVRQRSKYYVRCKDCDKSILSTSFKSHRAAHLNTPLVKCSICNKEYFSRSSCGVHLKRIHKKTKEEFDDCIIVYKKERISHLYIEQHENIQLTDEN